MSDEELIARLRDAVNGEHDMTPHGADVMQAADRIEALTDAFASLEKAASDVARRGAQIGPQWTKLTIALLVARAALAAFEKEGRA